GATPEPFAARLQAFRDGLGEIGFTEGQNVTIDYRWGDTHYEKLPTLAADLIRRGVSIIVATGTTEALAAKASTSTIPIVFAIASDPVALGLVTALNRPGGNLTGGTVLAVEVGPKKLELLHELVPKATLHSSLIPPIVMPRLNHEN